MRFFEAMSRNTKKLVSLSICTLTFAGFASTAAAMVPATACLPDVANNGPQWWLPNASDEDIAAEFEVGDVAKVESAGRLARTSLLWDPVQERVLVRVDVTGDESIEPDDDRFVIALSDDSGTLPELFVGFFPLRDCGDAGDCEGGAPVSEDAIEYSEATATTSLTWSPLSIDNPSASFEVVHPWVSVEVDDNGPTTTYAWTLTFALEVPVDGSGDIRPDLRAYASAIDHVPGPTSATEIELPVLCTASSPTSDDCLIFGAGMEEIPFDLPMAVEDTWTTLSSSCTSP